MGILPHSVNADIYLTRYGPAGGRRKGKCEDIGKIMVVHEFLIQLQQVGIIAENIREFQQFILLPPEEKGDKALKPFPVVEPGGG